MLEVKRYECDGGSLLVGNESVSVSLPNGYGDGVYRYKGKMYLEKWY